MREKIIIRPLGIRIKAGIDKVMLWVGGHEHFTLQFGARSGIFDLHKTQDKSRDHDPIWKARHSDLIEWIEKLDLESLLIEHLHHIYHPVNWAWLVEQSVWLLDPNDMDEDQFMESAAKVKDMDALTESFMDEILFLPAELLENRLKKNIDGRYMVYFWHEGELEMKGCLLQRETDEREPLFFYVDNDEMTEAMQGLADKLQPEIVALSTPEVAEELENWYQEWLKGRI